MKVAAIAALVVAAVVFGIVYFVQDKVGGKGLGSLPVGASLIEVMTFPVNVILFVLAVVSLVIAVAAFRDAQEGSNRRFWTRAYRSRANTLFCTKARSRTSANALRDSRNSRSNFSRT